MDQTPPHVAVSPGPGAKGGAGLAVASLVLGIVGVVTSLVVVGAFLGVVGLTLGALHLTFRKTGEGRRMARWGVGLSGVAVAASIGFAVLYVAGMRRAVEFMPGGPQGQVAAWEGRELPDFEVTAIDGTPWKLSALRGRPVVLDFWATWCPPCVQEIPHFIELRKAFSTNDLVILGVSAEDRAVLKPFVASRSMNYPVASLSDVELPEPYSDVNALPTTLFVDREGRLRKVLVGYQSLDRLREEAVAAGAAASAVQP